MHDPHGVTMMNAHDDLPEQSFANTLLQLTPLQNEVQQLTSLTELSYNLDVFGCGMLIYESDDVRRVHSFENLNLILDILQELNSWSLVFV